ncbi:MAG: protocatechuate 3,4-dioxygenase subunit alpha [Deltaproteobacteria bacterium]|nr:protocatechuate 3,4-dioxygenase subunit alpha [Deltaproteobacteria bacterium]
MTVLELTPSQTVGPFFHPCLLRPEAQGQVLVTPATAGVRLRLEGRVLDGDGQGLSDALVEIWQANAAGRYHHPGDGRPLPLDPEFIGFGRCGTDPAGGYWFETIKPGPVPFDKTTPQAPHICLAVFGRGLLNHLYTRLYFDDEPANGADPILARVPQPRRETLMARRSETKGIVKYLFDIVLQGQGETVFFNFGSSPA